MISGLSRCRRRINERRMISCARILFCHGCRQRTAPYGVLTRWVRVGKAFTLQVVGQASLARGRCTAAHVVWFVQAWHYEWNQTCVERILRLNLGSMRLRPTTNFQLNFALQWQTHTIWSGPFFESRFVGAANKMCHFIIGNNLALVYKKYREYPLRDRHFPKKKLFPRIGNSRIIYSCNSREWAIPNKSREIPESSRDFKNVSNPH